MPIRLWIQWLAWWKTQGPPPGLRADFHNAHLASWLALPHIAEKDRGPGKFLAFSRRSDFLQWGYDLGEDEGPEEFEAQ